MKVFNNYCTISCYNLSLLCLGTVNYELCSYWRSSRLMIGYQSVLMLEVVSSLCARRQQLQY